MSNYNYWINRIICKNYKKHYNLTMNCKKLLSILAICIYASTAQLGVHAFAMHGNAMEHHEDITQVEDTHEHESTSSHAHETQKEDCWHPEPSHDHDLHLTPGENEDHDHNGMTMCMTQSEWIIISDFSTKEIKVAQFVPPIPQYTYVESIAHQYFYSIEDPGWWEDHSFSKFLNTHYWSVIMHC